MLIIIIILLLLTSCNSNSMIESGELVCLNCNQSVIQNPKCSIPWCPLNDTCTHKIDLDSVAILKVPQPELLCRESQSLTYTWNKKEDWYYFIKYSQFTRNDGNVTAISEDCNYVTINDLEPNCSYEIELHSFNNKSEIYRSKSIKHSTAATTAEKIFPVRNLNYSLIFMDDLYHATVFWEPGADFSCYYKIVWNLNDDVIIKHQSITLKELHKCEYQLNQLEFGKKYYFSIRSTDNKLRSRESAARSIYISVPTCISTFKNLSICAPSKPKNFRIAECQSNEGFIKNEKRVDLNLFWNKPNLIPDFYIISHASEKDVLNSYSVKTKVDGNLSSVILRNISTDHNYMFQIVSHSAAGQSQRARAHCYFNIQSSDEFHREYIDESANYKAVLLWIVLGLSLACGIFIIAMFRKKLLKTMQRYLKLTESNVPMTVKYTASSKYDSEWELIESKLFIDQVIGFGAFGIVQKGFYYLESNVKTIVAVKTLKTKPTEEQILQFYGEIEIMKSVPYHAHIIQLIGVVTKNRPDNPLMLVEYCPGGDLHSFLRKAELALNNSPSQLFDIGVDGENYCHSKDGTKFFNMGYDLDLTPKKNKFLLESKDLISFARQIVLGMEFLSNLKVVHRDLAARNILISDDNILKISDFGLSRDIYTDNVYKKFVKFVGKLPFRWMALESLTHQVYNTESDVWSFGIVLWEIVTLGANPYPTINAENLIPMLKRGYRMERPLNCSEEVYDIMLRCWTTSPNLRPNFKELRELFDNLLESKVEYISIGPYADVQYANMTGRSAEELKK